MSIRMTSRRLKAGVVALALIAVPVAAKETVKMTFIGSLTGGNSANGNRRAGG